LERTDLSILLIPQILAALVPRRRLAASLCFSSGRSSFYRSATNERELGFYE
jgi:hypothetical protein